VTALDDRVRAVLERLEREDADERARGVPAAERARQVARTTGELLFALAAPHQAASILEIGGSRGYSTIWLAAGARIGGGRVVSLEYDPRKLAVRRRNVEEAGLAEVAELVDADAFEAIPELDGPFDLCFLDAEKDDYERLFSLAREKLRPGSVVVADNVLSHVETLGAYSAARQADASLVSVTVPLDRGLEVTVVL
jgi:predicted O-methyltransferase YrrM